MSLTHRRFAHWELGILLEAAILGHWLVEPSLWAAVLAGALAVAAVVDAVRRSRLGPVLTAAGALVAALAALDASSHVRVVEKAWPAERARLVTQANRALGSTLDNAVTLVRTLAEAGAVAGTADRETAFRALGNAVRGPGPERSLVVLDSAGRPWAWAGRHRIAVLPHPEPELETRITPFYVMLEAHRQAPGHRLVAAQVLLSADSAIPDRGRSLAAGFSQRLGTGLQFFPPRLLLPPPADAFLYCVPGCDAPTADSLFSVRAVPPAQGSQKLALLETGSRWTGILLIASLLLLALAGGIVARWGGVLGSLGLLVFTPVGGHLGLENLFSSATFFLDTLGAFSASAGAVLVTAGVAIVAVFALAYWRVPSSPWLRSVGVAVALAATPTLIYLARGITLPPTDVPIGLWLSWQVTLAIAGALILIVAAVLVRGRSERVTPAVWAWAAVAAAVLLAIVGLVIWQPASGWPRGFALAWLPVAWLATRPAPRVRLVATIGLVAAVGAATLTWSTVVRGRLTLAERDLDRLSGGDPLVMGMLEQFARELTTQAPPRTAAALYARWRASPLAHDDYPAVLATWAPDGNEQAVLELAELGVTPAFLEAYASSVRDQASPVTLELEVQPGKHYVTAVPLRNGWVVTVAVAPRSQLIPPVLVARFLRGERRLTAPYSMSLGEAFRPLTLDERTEWRRIGWTVRGTHTVRVPDAARHVYVDVEMGELVQLVVRGTLVALLDVVLLALLWVLGEAVAGRTRGLPDLRRWLPLGSYRTRLALALAGFFVIPTVGFAVWSASRLQLDAARTRDLVIQQTLLDAVGSARVLLNFPAEERPSALSELSQRLNADLLWYDGGALNAASANVLDELGLLERYLPVSVYRQIVFEDELEVTDETVIGGQLTRVGYRSMGWPRTAAPVLAAPRLVDVTGLHREQEDLALSLLLTTLVGLAGAVGLATLAARSLARPVQSLRSAAESVGRGEPIAPFDPGVPTEFASVVEAFERMAHDVEASQHALETARRRTATVLANVATGVVAVDRSLRVVIANPRAEELFGVLLRSGIAVGEATGAPWRPVWEWVSAFLGRGEELDAAEFTVADRQIRVQAAALVGDPRGVVVALDDTTELARAVRVLAWGELARQIAHEIKNPLTPIRLGVQHLQRSRRDGSGDFDATLERTSRQILAEIERLDAIARAFARFGAPPATATPVERVDLVTIARDTAALYALSNAEVAVRHDGAVEALVRKDEVKEVLINLIENARDAGATHVTVAVRSGEAGEATIQVEDDGRGIPRDNLGRVFEPQFSTTTSGTGLGLAICRRLVESWGGTIEVESAEQVGTTVRIVVPTGVDD